MAFFVFVPTINPEHVKLKDDVLRDLASDTTLDTATLRNVFYGDGIACLRRSTEQDQAERVAEGLALHKIPFLFTRSEDLETVPVHRTTRLTLCDSCIEFRTAKGTLAVAFDEPIVLASDRKWRDDALNRNVMGGQQLLIATKEKAFVFRPADVTVEDLPNTSNYSKVHNIVLLLEILLKRAHKVHVDSSYPQLKVILEGGFDKYAGLLSLALGDGLVERG